jgi:hypothetical protein
VILPRSHASLVEVSIRSGRPQAWLEDQAARGRIAAVQSPDGWLMERDRAEAVIAQWRTT